MGIRSFLAQAREMERFHVFGSTLLALRTFLAKRYKKADRGRILAALDEKTKEYFDTLSIYSYYARIGAPLSTIFSKQLSAMIIDIWNFIWDNELVPVSILNRAMRGLAEEEDRILKYTVKFAEKGGEQG